MEDWGKVIIFVGVKENSLRACCDRHLIEGSVSCFISSFTNFLGKQAASPRFVFNSHLPPLRGTTVAPNNNYPKTIMRMKTLTTFSLRVALLLLALAGVTTTATAYDFEQDGIFYDVNSDGTTVAVTYETTNYNSYSGEVTIPNFVTHDGITYTVTTINDYAFRECSELMSIVIADSVKTIGMIPFVNCTELRKVTIGLSITRLFYKKASMKFNAFQNCDNITSLTWNARNCSDVGGMGLLNLEELTVGPEVEILPNNSNGSPIKLVWNAINCPSQRFFTNQIQEVTIGNNVQVLPYGFLTGSKITSLVIPNSVTSIGDYAFMRCQNLTHVSLPNSLTAISNYMFCECSALTNINIPETVTSIGKRAFYHCSELTNLNIPSGVDSIGDEAFSGCTNLTGTFIIPNGITAIADSAFVDCTQLEQIFIPNTVTSIGKYAFYCCTGLNDITIPQSVTSIGDLAFAGCTGLTNITIPNLVFEIGQAAFSGCTGLTSIHIPASVNSIGINPFSYCPEITTMTVDGDNPVYDSRNGCNAIIQTNSNKLISGCHSTIIPNTVDTIGEYAFEFCQNLTSITIPTSVTTIERAAFWGCNGLTKIIIPSSVISIAHSAFAGHSGLTSMIVEDSNPIYDSRDNCNAIIVTGTNTLLTGCKTTVVPNTVSTIGEYSFERCTGLTEIDIPESVTNIGIAAFLGCDHLESIHLGNSLETIDVAAFYECSRLDNVIIPNSVKIIRESAFESCTGLTNVIIGEAVDTIGMRAFWKCTGLTQVTIPNSVTSLGWLAFQDCTALTNITIGSGVTEMGAVFAGCDALESVTCYATTPPNLVSLSEPLEDGSRVSRFNFSDKVYEQATLYVPAESIEAYQSSKWKNFRDIQPIPEPGDVNGDSEVNIADVNHAVKAILNGDTDERFDVNGDGEINIADINAIVKIILGIS